MGTAYNANIVTDGLVLCLDAANPRSYPLSGTSWNDLSGNGNHRDLAAGNMGSENWTNGVFDFDGSNEFVECEDIPFRFSNLFSISVWFYWDGINKLASICGKRQGTSPYNQYSIFFGDNPYTSVASNKINFFARKITRYNRKY